MKTLSQFVHVFVLAVSSVAFAQAPEDVPPPPLPPPLPPPEAPRDAVPEAASGDAPETSGETAASPGDSASGSSAAPEPVAAPATPSHSADTKLEPTETSEADSANAAGELEAEAESSERSRLYSLAFANTLLGASGVLRVISADSAAPGTFRMSVVGSFFSGSGVLCPACTLGDGSVSDEEDELSVYSQHFQLSLTPRQFLELSAALRYQQTTDSLGSPSVFHISGDATLGAKAFVPVTQSELLSFGGGAELGLLTRGNGVGYGATNVRLHLESTVDLTRPTLQGTSEGVPLRGHMNFGYLFDNSSKMIENVEDDRSDEAGSRQRITRIERFGKDINRVDSLRVGLGLEGVFSYTRPFAEWTLDLPVNRQGYTCYPESSGADDSCLSRASFSAIPSRLSLGLRAYPWFSTWSEGFSLLAAVDIATGGSSSFLEEMAPELPWNFHFGLGYAFDTEPRLRTVRVEKVRVEKVPTVAAPPPPKPFIEGTVVDQETGAGVAQASVLFEAPEHQGLLTNANGNFRSDSLKPGHYRLRVSKQGYADGECSVTLAAPSPKTHETASDPASNQARAVASSVRCELTALPKGGNLEGSIRDSATSAAVVGVSVRITDPRGRSLVLNTDEIGAFRFENVPEGSARLDFEARGYAPLSIEVDVKARDTVTLKLSLPRAR